MEEVAVTIKGKKKNTQNCRQAGDRRKTPLETEIDVQNLPRSEAGAKISGKAHSCSRPWMSRRWDQVSLWQRHKTCLNPGQSSIPSKSSLPLRKRQSILLTPVPGKGWLLLGEKYKTQLSSHFTDTRQGIQYYMPLEGQEICSCPNPSKIQSRDLLLLGNGHSLEPRTSHWY